MAKELECLVETCQATIQAETAQEVLARAERHVGQSHPQFELNDETVENIRAGMTDI